jgi:hypothetical protein
VGETVRRGLGQRIRVHENRGGDAAPAEANALAEIGHPEGVRPMLDEDRGHLGRAVAVAVGLDHREDLPLRPHEAAHGAQIRRRGVEIDLERRRPG